MRTTLLFILLGAALGISVSFVMDLWRGIGCAAVFITVAFGTRGYHGWLDRCDSQEPRILMSGIALLAGLAVALLAGFAAGVLHILVVTDNSGTDWFTWHTPYYGAAVLASLVAYVVDRVVWSRDH